MNDLQAVRQRSRYVEEPHLVITLDGEPLDSLLARLAKNHEIEGLVTTLDDCLSDPKERPVVRERVLPTDGATAIVPILVCPDDLDFYCTVVVVQVTRIADRVRWERFGHDQTDSPMPERVGGNVEWFEGVGPFAFGLEEYQRFLDSCRALKTEWWVERAPSKPTPPGVSHGSARNDRRIRHRLPHLL